MKHYQMKDKKRVVIDVNSVMPLYRYGWISGIGRTTKELVESMARIENPPVELMLYSQNTRGVSGKRLGLNLPTRHLPLPHKAWMNQIVAHTHFRETLTHYDLLHVPHNFEWVRRPDKTVITMHDAMFFACPDEVFDYRYEQQVYPTLAKQCRGIITCSESSKRDIMRYMGINEEKIFVCRWGYDKDVFFPRSEKKRGYPYFLSVSCSMGRKNTMTLIKAYEQFIKQGPLHELVLVWPNTPQEALNYCNQPHLRNHIYVTNDIDDERLSILYNEASATFFPSRYEGFGLPVLESMACGTPVVTSNNSSLPEVGGEAAIYTDPDDIDGLRRIMEQFENGELKKSDYRERCLKQASQFSWERCAQQTIDVYQKLLEN